MNVFKWLRTPENVNIWKEKKETAKCRQNADFDEIFSAMAFFPSMHSIA